MTPNQYAGAPIPAIHHHPRIPAAPALADSDETAVVVADYDDVAVAVVVAVAEHAAAADVVVVVVVVAAADDVDVDVVAVAAAEHVADVAAADYEAAAAICRLQIRRLSLWLAHESQ